MYIDDLLFLAKYRTLSVIIRKLFSLVSLFTFIVHLWVTGWSYNSMAKLVTWLTSIQHENCHVDTHIKLYSTMLQFILGLWAVLGI